MINTHVIHMDESEIITMIPEVLETTQPLADLRDRARHEGFEEGYREGLEKAQQESAEHLAIFDQNCQSILDILSVAIAKAEVLITEKKTELEKHAAIFAVELVETIISHEIEEEKINILDTINHALSLLPVDSEMVARINPEDMEFINSQKIDLRINLVADPAIEKAGCILEVGSAMVDARISEAIKRIKSELHQQMSGL